MLDRSQLTTPLASQMQQSEIEKFNLLAQEWWNENGRFKSILQFNHARLQIIQQQIFQHFKSDISDPKPLAGLSVIDIGCGAGLLAAPLAKLGATVTGIDASAENIAVARAHAVQSGLEIDYQHCLAETLVEKNRHYDIVLNTEVIEHVPDQQALADTCAQLLKTDGLLCMATLNRNWFSFLVAIIGAEYVLRMLPTGTHDWRFFVRPQEMQAMLGKHHLKPAHLTGLKFNPFLKSWSVDTKARVNYLMFLHK